MPTWHPDFDRHPDHRWTGKLQPLFAELDTRARARRGAAPWFVLRSGAFVKLEILEDGRRKLQIARNDKPKDPIKGPTKFALEVDAFAEYFNITHWERTPDPTARGIRCVLVEPMPVPPFCGNCAGTKDTNASSAGSLICTECAMVAKKHGLVPCDRCGKLVPKEAAYDVMHCQACAVACGRETSAIIARQRTEAAT